MLDQERLKVLLKTKLGENFDRAAEIMNNYGERLFGDVANALLHAVDKEKVPEVLGILEEHWNTELQYQHPHVRGMKEMWNGTPTEIMFLKLCQETLGLTPNSAAYHKSDP
jgi:hypothetical protein